jgi:predicted DNA-binding WGR domain protein
LYRRHGGAIIAAMPNALHQPSLFPENVSLCRIDPAKNEWRFYRMSVAPDLFGRATLIRHWGRIGTQGRMRLDAHPDPGSALNALGALVRTKRRRGYRERHSIL